MKKIITLGTLCIMSLPIITAVSCSTSGFSPRVHTLYTSLEDEIFEIQSKKISVYKDDTSFHLIIPNSDDLSEHPSSLYSGATRTRRDFWNMNPSESDVTTHIDEYEITTKFIEESIDDMLELLDDAKEIVESKNIESDEITNLLTTFDIIKSESTKYNTQTAEDFAVAVEDAVNSYDLIESAILEGNTEKFDPRWEFAWTSKLFGPTEKLQANNDVWHIIDIIFNVYVQTTFRNLEFYDLLK